jgi:putative transposase
MPNYRRYYIPNGIVFITAVTKNRNHYLKNDEDITMLFETLSQVQQIHPFHILAYVILPDHFHWLMTVGNTVGDFSTILKSIKWNYTFQYKKVHHILTAFNLWQRGFWDHIIRNEQDLKNHIDYIHWNPIKHNYVNSPFKWKYSTFSYWYERGYYPSNFIYPESPSNIITMDFE